MRTYPYLVNPARLKTFFGNVQTLGVPARVTTKYLESIGFRSKNDRAILTVIKALGFVDSAGAPTEAWRRSRNKETARAVMASALRATYSDLFQTYPDACRRDNEALRNFFSTHTDVGEGALRFMVGTFRALCELADFDADSSSLSTEDEELAANVGPERAKGAVAKQSTAVTSGITMNINIQLAIPDTTNAETYEHFFAAMKRHILT